MKRIYVPDLECDSCVKLVSRKLKKLGGVDSFAFGSDYVDVQGAAKESAVIAAVKDAGFRASTEEFERKSFGERWRHWREHPEQYVLERRMLAYAGAVFALLLGVHALGLGLYPGASFLPWLVYLDASIAVLGAALWHFYSYRTKVTCMVGMMIGMTFGMQTGMLLGAVVGATNGFFTGAMTGMLIGTAAGAITGRCCGVMGVMEGMMAGVMGGTMGAMITVMMLTDRVHWFMPFYAAINIVIALSLAYLYLEESVEGKPHEKVHRDFPTFAAACVLAALLLTAVMLYGPKAPLFGGL